MDASPESEPAGTDAVSDQLQAKRSWPWRGDYAPHDHLSGKNLLNAFLCLTALVPSYVAVYFIYTRCPTDSASYASWLDATCTVSMAYPIALANALFFLNVSVGFWIVGLLQRSFWLIDPYWTVIPPLLAHLYQLHPLAAYDLYRSCACLVLIWAWSVRLTHSYFRREEWRFGQREDWRYTKMQRDGPRSWPVVSFFAVGLAQQPMLVGITLPAYTIHFVSTPSFDVYDGIIAACCAAGILIAAVADNQLREYMMATPKPSPILDSGLWRYSRHPNYFGEQLWWWSFAAYSVRLGQWYFVGGTLFNSIILAVVTVMTEQKMLSNWPAARASLYREYMRTTSPLIPFCKYGGKPLL